VSDQLHRYAVHGYAVASDVALAAPPGDADGAPDLVLRRGAPRSVPRAACEGLELARIEDERRAVYYSMIRRNGRVRLRFGAACEFEADPGLTDVTHHADPAADPGLVGVLASGTLLAVRLVLDGKLALHASAVAVDGSVVAFVGASGMGKSTLAALVCAGAGELFTDDVLHVSGPRSAPIAWPGATECRLRDSATSVTGLYNGDGSVRPTADGRTAVTPPRRATAPLPLAACVIPLPSRQARAVQVRRLARHEALLSLVRFPRIVGWREPASTARQFQLLADLVEAVPVLEARVPWGPPFSTDIAMELVEAVLAQR
jgi:hypothetical protein